MFNFMSTAIKIYNKFTASKFCFKDVNKLNFKEPSQSSGASKFKLKKKITNGNLSTS